MLRKQRNELVEALKLGLVIVVDQPPAADPINREFDRQFYLKAKSVLAKLGESK